MVKSALKKHEVDSMKPLDETTEIQILSMLIKQRKESADMFRKGNRTEVGEEKERARDLEADRGLHARIGFRC